MTLDAGQTATSDDLSPKTLTEIAMKMFKKSKHVQVWKYLLAIAGLVTFCFTVTLTTQIGITLTPLTPYDPAYYGWSNTLAGRRILAVLNSDLNPCALEHRKTIVVETMDTVTATTLINPEPTTSPFDIVLTLDPSGRTSIMERPLAAKYSLIKYDMSVNQFWHKKGCENSFGSMFMTTPVAPRPLPTSTPVSAK